MREIKFRAWDKLTKTMRYVLCIDWLNDLVDLNGGIIERKYNNSEDDEVILMQYIGLKDNNGKEIYEGDILNVLSSTRIVIFDENTCSFMLKDIGLRNELFSLNNKKCKDLEIIANIYENKELIRNENK